ncbi:hypothetical protein [Acetobacter sp. AAB5]|uniref:hypothetical protein n=1 Tax=Acetobacter sp. AAB5 TaxID=3418370 RepID=UPI003CF65938
MSYVRNKSKHQKRIECPPEQLYRGTVMTIDHWQWYDLPLSLPCVQNMRCVAGQ